MVSVDDLRQVEMLRGMDDATLEQLSQVSRDVQFAPMETLFRQHDEAKDVFFILEGSVSVAVCAAKIGCRRIGEVSHGGLVGWSALLNRPRMSAAAQALAPVRAIAIEGAPLMALCRQSPELGFELMCSVSGVLADRLSSARLQLFEACFGQLPEVQIESD